MAVFFHPDYTVGSGIGPDLLTLHIRDFALVRSTLECKRSRARVLAHAYRRWGIAPRPEDVREYRRTGAHSLTGHLGAMAECGPRLAGHCVMSGKSPIARIVKDLLIYAPRRETSFFSTSQRGGDTDINSERDINA
ncbi:hypothetical protein PK69_13925 [Xanthomonas phaseoli pv. phaseoli]|uniref:Uncharacterized protein n=1 Tax=Xanthomonas campestris pv. phaseoli TaxID=317013 RepID=A0AB34QH83_XANCH|nr:hypothetical protein AC609_03950 [Xanthomonas phaseoli pv. phaseoli]AZU29024.1 hypothetical protein AC801_03890 [Xanthomonas sp. ISO98C4]AZU24653.1 hypothetical protein AC611_03955 [Xanthomonas phaseoli pv. phaseoli]AZU33420.1 hypothetical protein AC610_03950 [Xanthomonas phaseoli pv. phaseoli]KGT52150.1 hypothetical protein NZ02_06140 [Xanthomonas phaseoli pv. phaseoli]